MIRSILRNRYTYERLGGVLFLNTELNSDKVEYNVDFVENPNVVASCALPSEVLALFEALGADTELREAERYPEWNPFVV